METLLNIQQAKELTDLQVRENLAECKKWENKFEDISTCKVKIDKEVVGLDISHDYKEKLYAIVNKAKDCFKSKLADLKKG